MEQIAFKMFLNSGQADLYKKRHDEIWGELVRLLKDAGISDYSIFLDPETNTLFAILRRIEGHQMDQLPKHEVMPMPVTTTRGRADMPRERRHALRRRETSSSQLRFTS